MIQKAIEGLRRLGIPIRLTQIRENSFIPGVWIDRGTLVVNPEHVFFLGDIFHESGHLAITPSRLRSFWTPNTNLDDPEAELAKEMYRIVVSPEGFALQGEGIVRQILQMGEAEAIAWEYAAILEVGFDPVPIFAEPSRLSGEGLELLSNLSSGCYLGIHGLHHSKMSTKRGYPKMLKWMQD